MLLHLRLVAFPVLLVATLACAVAPATAQETAAQEAARREAALSSLPRDAARRVFGAIPTAFPGDPKVVGEYWKGCYSGGVRMEPVGEHWQAMRLSRNRNWGTPRLIAFLENFAAKAAKETGWPGILLGDMSQPAGGPMLTGHASHQLGIEADIWLRPMPDRRWTPEENETVLSTDLVRSDGKDVDQKLYKPQHLALLRAAAMEPDVARVFVNAAIKKALCRDAGKDRAWLRKIRPAAGHSYHFHIRLACPKDQKGCVDQAPPEAGDGCGKELDWWFTAEALHPKGGKGGGAPLMVASMPQACRDLVTTPTATAALPGHSSSVVPPVPPVAVDRATRSTVFVEVLIDPRHRRYGSGVIVALRDGVATIVTARHVVDSAFDGSGRTAPLSRYGITARFGSEPARPATVEWVAPHGVDLALLSAPLTSPDARAAEVPAKVELHATDALVTLLQPAPSGDPAAPASNAAPTAVRGAVTQVREVQQDGYNFRQLQTDLPIRNGDSGGGILDADGRLVAISAMRALTPPGSAAVSFATPVDLLRELAAPGLAAPAANAAETASATAAKPSQPLAR